MAIKIYTENFPDEILEQLKKLYLIGNKDRIIGIYVNTFLGKVRDANILTEEKLVYWATKINNENVKKIITFKKVKDITYSEKGIYSTITYHLSMNKSFDLKINRKDGEKFYQLSLEAWEKSKQLP